MSTTIPAPDLHQWLDTLTPGQQDHLRVMVDQSGVLPPVASPSVENWLRTTVVATCERIAAGTEKMFTSEEADAWLEATRAARA
jgi:hypothetical protein